MPTPRQHGGAALINIPLSTPAFKGLNTQQRSALLTSEWATRLENAIIDDSGRCAARKGLDNLTTTAITGEPIKRLYELVESDGGTQLIAFTDASIYTSSNGGASWTSIEGTVAVTDANWWAVNFNDTMIAVQSGKTPIRYTGTGNFTAIADVNVPTGGIALSAFGRMWITTTTGHTLKYSALLDATNWTTSDSGSLDLWNIWPDNDEITGLAAHNGALVVFGRKTIVFFTDGQGSALGVDPAQMYVVDIIKGTGCLSQNTIQSVDGDLWFVSEYGLQSLGRLIAERSNPISNLSKNVQDEFTSYFNPETSFTNVRSVFSPRDRVYLLSLPSGTETETGLTWVFDTRGRLEDGSARSLGVWSLVPRAAVYTRGGLLLFSVFGSSGKVGQYTGQIDDTSTYQFVVETGWLDLTQQGYLIFPKRYEGIFFADATIILSFGWAFDFEETFEEASRTFTIASGGGEWGSGEWGTAEFGGGVTLRRAKTPANGNGEYIKLRIQSTINGNVLAVQQLDLFAKIGRFA